MSDLIERVDAARRFPTNTCPASRHAAQIGEALVRRWRYPMLTEEPAHCGESILATVAALWEARTEIERLTAALQHEADCVEAAKAEIERMTEENRRLRADLLAGRNVVNAGLTIHTLTLERDDLRRQLAEAEQDTRRFDWLAERLEDVQIDDANPLEHYHGDEEDVPYSVLWRRAIDATIGASNA